MIFLPDTNACITLLRERNTHLIARWQSTKATDVVLCSVVVYELRHGAERSSNPDREHAKLDVFLSPFISMPSTITAPVFALKYAANSNGLVR